MTTVLDIGPLQYFSKLFSLLYFVGIFVVVIAYVLRPSNRRTFDAAARIPLSSDET